MYGGFSKDGIETRSEEVQEIISRMPTWIVSYGLTLLFIILVGLFWMTWFIRYPDVIKADIVITTYPPPVTLVARNSGSLLLLKPENEPLKPGELIAYLQSGTRVEDLLELEAHLQESSSIDLLKSGQYQLGELQGLLNQLLSSNEELDIFHKNDLMSTQVRGLLSQIQSYHTLNRNLEQQRELEAQELLLAGEKFRTDSLLYTQRVISRQEYNSASATYLSQQRNFMNSKASIVTNTMQIQQMEKQIAELKAANLERENQLVTAVTGNRKSLLAEIKKWKETHLFISPMSGKLAFLSFLENDQYIEAGSPLFTVVPKTTAMYGKVDLPISGSGKVKLNQSVNIRLDNFPFEQYGMLKGTVASISALPKEDAYKVTIDLPEGLKSSYNQTLPFREQLQGQTEIITEDLRLTERIFYQFRKMIRMD